MLISVIVALFSIATVIYAIITPDMYRSSVSLKITAPKGNILSSIGDLQDFGNVSNDRYIANEIETIYNSAIMREVAESIIDSFKSIKYIDDLSLVVDKNYFQSKSKPLKSVDDFTDDLYENVQIIQKSNLDFIEITAQSPSPYEAALIANKFAEIYQEFNLQESREQITVIKEFLGEQLEEKHQALFEAEDAIKAYQLNKGGAELDRRAQLLVNKLSNFESQKNTAKIEMSISREKLNQYKTELEKKDPTIYDFLANKSSEPYLQNLQREIANLETQRDVALASSKTSQAKDQIVNDFNSKITALKDKLNTSMMKYQNLILASSPEEVKALSKKTFEEEVNYRSLEASYNSLTNVLNSYEAEFNRLPSATLEIARLERKRQFEENIYNKLSEKYQEAQLNEQAILGNVLIMNEAYPSYNPSKPNRTMVIIVGLFVGFVFAFGFAYIKNYYLDKTIKSPEDIDSQNIKFLTWIPKIKRNKKQDTDEFIMFSDPDNIVSESFKALRTRIQFSKSGQNVKSILVTSASPSEGKTFNSINLAGSFAKDGKKTILIDCDLRKPRIHLVMDDNSKPTLGLSDFLCGKAPMENIIKISKFPKLDFITAGTIHSNSSEILNSKKMIILLQKLREIYDFVILDSPPILAVADTEVLSNFVDASILVVSSNSTEIDWVKQAVDLLKRDQSTFLGVVLNNYDFKFGYPSSYKYYSYYHMNDDTKRDKKLFKQRVKEDRN